MDAKPSDEASGSALQVPERAHLPRESIESSSHLETDSDSELEATELRQLDHEVRNHPMKRRAVIEVHAVHLLPGCRIDKLLRAGC